MKKSLETILNYQIIASAASECISMMAARIESDIKTTFACANPYSLEIARKDLVFDHALKSADFLVPDGIGIVIASKIFGGAIRQRITGTDIFMGLCGWFNQRNGCTMFFLGSTAENLEQIQQKARQNFPNIRIVGMYAPPFKAEFDEEDNRRMIEAVNQVNPDLLWIGMTAPKQEKWIYQHKDSLNVKFIGAIGAVFDFYTGNVKRSHPIFQKMGLEWLPRLLRQPRRLYNRTLVSAPKFLFRIIREKNNRNQKS